MKFRQTLLTAALLAVPAVAGAQPLNGPYINLSGGAAVEEVDHEKSSITGFAQSFGSFPIHLDTGYIISGAAGYAFGNGNRVELEGAYRTNAMKTGVANGNALTYYGNNQNMSAIVSAIHDFDLGLPVSPFVGAGVGVSDNKWDNVRRTAINLSGSGLNGANVITGSEALFAMQAQAGVSHDIPSVPGLSVSLGYKYLWLPGTRKFSQSLTISGTPAVCAANGGGCGTYTGKSTYGEQFNHSFLIGLTYSFGAPAAAAPAAAPVAAAMAPAPVARSYIVFFDWDKAALTDRAKQIVADAAAASAKVQVTRIEVNGYTDTSGTATYNQSLSVARAKAVMAELVKDGVPASAITVMGYGETHLLVQTAAGVREPQNRRVEIILK